MITTMTMILLVLSFLHLVSALTVSITTGVWTDENIHTDCGHYTSTLNNSVSFTFNGPSIHVLGDLGGSYGGTMQITLDGQPTGLVDLSGSTICGKVLFSSTSISNGQHSINLELTGKSPDVTGTEGQLRLFVNSILPPSRRRQSRLWGKRQMSLPPSPPQPTDPPSPPPPPPPSQPSDPSPPPPPPPPSQPTDPSPLPPPSQPPSQLPSPSPPPSSMTTGLPSSPLSSQLSPSTISPSSLSSSAVASLLDSLTSSSSRPPADSTPASLSPESSPPPTSTYTPPKPSIPPTSTLSSVPTVAEVATAPPPDLTPVQKLWTCKPYGSNECNFNSQVPVGLNTYSLIVGTPATNCAGATNSIAAVGGQLTISDTWSQDLNVGISLGSGASDLVLNTPGQQWENSQTQHLSEVAQMAIPPGSQGALIARVVYNSTKGNFQIGAESPFTVIANKPQKDNVAYMANIIPCDSGRFNGNFTPVLAISAGAQSMKPYSHGILVIVALAVRILL